MPRLIKSPNSGSNIVNAVTPEQGGHGEVTARDALEAMDLVSRDSIGKFGRPIPLDENGYIDQKYLQDLYASMETISGDGSIEVNQTKEYFLTGYDAFSNYDVRAVSGMVSRDRNVITYTAPGAPGQGGFTVNGRMVALTVTAANTVEGIAPPVILTPVRGTSGLVGPVSVTSAPFVTDNGETHASTSWQCAEDPGFTTIVASVDQSVVDKTSWSIGTVTLGKHYFIRAKYHGSAGSVSPWSEETHFTSPVPTPADRPNITSPVNGATRLPSRVTLTSSPYSTVTGDPHISSSWQISENSLFTSIAFELTNSTVNKTSWQVSGLQPAKEYYARVRYRGQLHEYTEWSPASSFRTRLAFLPETEIGKSGSYNGVTADMDDIGGRWIVGNGSSSITGVNCAAYIYRREGGLPVLEDTVQAVVGEKTLTSTIPSGGQLTVTVAGRYSSTKSYTQAEEIIIPAGAQSLTLVGKGSSSNEVTAFVVGNGSAQIPAGTTNLKLIGKGSDGTTVYNPGQPYVAEQPELLMQATGSVVFNYTDAAVQKSATLNYVVSARSSTTAGSTSTIQLVNFTVTGYPPSMVVDGQVYNGISNHSLGFITNSLGNLVASYNARTETMRLWFQYVGNDSGSGAPIDKVFEIDFTVNLSQGHGVIPEQPYIAPSTTTTNGVAATMTIQGQTYTYPGGLGGPATPRTDNITLNGTAQALTYNIPTGGSGQYGYPGSTGISQSLAGSGEYIFPLGTPKITITAKGGDGVQTANPTTYTGGVLITNTSNPYYVPGARTYGSYGSQGTPSYDGENELWLGQGGWISYSDGSPSTFTIQGITKTFPGGIGGPATPSTEEITLDGSDLSMNYSIPATGSGVVSVSYTTSATPARETTAVINGQTYTFPGSSNGAASNTTFNIDLVANYNFANGVAINQDGTLAAICSSPRAANVPGYVLILQRSGTTWTIVDELKRDDGLVWNAQSVSMDKTGNYVLVGADAQPSGSTKIGSFALYRRLAGKYAVEQIVIAPDPGVAYEAGSSVSLSGNAAIAVIGAPAGGADSRVLVYERDGNNTLVLKATLSKTTDPHSSDALGTRVYISADGSTIAASSPTSRGVNTSHANCGEVLIFRKIDDVWTQVSTVRHPTPASGLYFGQDIHLSDDGFTLSVGVPGGTGGLGEVMFFDIEGSNTVYKSNVVSSAVTGGSNFGKAIALPGHSGDLVGASKFGTYVFD